MKYDEQVGKEKSFPEAVDRDDCEMKKDVSQILKAESTATEMKEGILGGRNSKKVQMQKKKKVYILKRKGKRPVRVAGVPVQDSSGKATWKWAMEGFGCPIEEFRFPSRKASWSQQHFRNINLARVCQSTWSRED